MDAARAVAAEGGRRKPPQRRPAFVVPVTWRTEAATHSFEVIVGFHPATGEMLEVFYAGGQREWSQLKCAIQDACVLISLLLQHGVGAEDIGKSIGSAPVFGRAEPATTIGAIVRALSEFRLDEFAGVSAGKNS